MLLLFQVEEGRKALVKSKTTNVRDCVISTEQTIVVQNGKVENNTFYRENKVAVNEVDCIEASLY